MQTILYLKLDSCVTVSSFMSAPVHSPRRAVFVSAFHSRAAIKARPFCVIDARVFKPFTPQPVRRALLNAIDHPGHAIAAVSALKSRLSPTAGGKVALGRLTDTRPSTVEHAPQRGRRNDVSQASVAWRNFHLALVPHEFR